MNGEDMRVSVEPLRPNANTAVLIELRVVGSNGVGSEDMDGWNKPPAYVLNHSCGLTSSLAGYPGNLVSCPSHGPTTDWSVFWAMVLGQTGQLSEPWSYDGLVSCPSHGPRTDRSVVRAMVRGQIDQLSEPWSEDRSVSCPSHGLTTDRSIVRAMVWRQIGQLSVRFTV